MSAPGHVTVNGQLPVAGVSPYDRGLHFGDGLFETLVCLHGRARFLSLHLERLALGCERLRINLRNLTPVREEIEQVAASTRNALLKLIVTRGDAAARGYGIAGGEVATRMLFRYPLPPQNESLVRDGIRVRVAALHYGENERLAGLKHLNRLEQVLARSEVPAEDADELLVFSSAGNLVSGTMSNVFIVNAGRIRTPRVDRCGVAGVMRRVVLREAQRAGVSVEEAALSADDLRNAAEVFVTNARIGIWPVRSVDARAMGVGPVTRQLQAHLAPILEQAADA